ncbi:MAG: glycosyltransferase family 4 protein [Thermosulfidibacteraceae bacterium]|jgi:glycosyltransferase involved in cell wall biosynthesis
MGTRKIAQVISRNSCSSGGSIQALLLAKGLKDIGFDVFFVSRGGDCESRASALSLKHVRQPMNWSIKSILSFLGFVKKEKIDILHAHKGRALTFSILASFLIGSLKVFANRGVIYSLSWTNRWKYKIPLTRGIVCVSHEIGKKLVKDGLPAKRIFVAYGNIDDKFFVNHTKGGILEGKGFFVGMIGNIRPDKGHMVTGEAIKILSRVLRKVKFVVAGKEDRTIVSKLIEVLGDDFLSLGYRRDVERVIVDLDVVVNASTHEGISGAVREAMAMGKPVVVSAIPGNSEIVEHKKNGFVFKVGDKMELCKYLLFLLFNPKVGRKVGSNGRVYARRFSLKKRVESVLEIYNNA